MAKRSRSQPRSEAQIRELVDTYIATRPDLDRQALAQLSFPVLCIWRAVEATYELEGVGPSGPLGFTLKDFATNLRRFFPEIFPAFGNELIDTLVEQYVSMLEHMSGGRAAGLDVARRLDQGVDDLMRSDLPSQALH